MAEKVLVLGSNSFSGASMVAHLLAAGHEVLGVSRSPEPHEAFLPYRWLPKAEGFRFFRLDLNHDLDRIMALVDRERPQWFMNFAAQSMVAESWQNPDHWMMTNVVSTVRLHEQLRHSDSLARYIHVTTPEVYGSTSGFVKEDAPFNPSTPYAVSRAAGDMSLRSYFAAYKFPVLFTRAANVYGPGQQLYRVIPRAIMFIRLRKRLQLHGGGHSTRSFIHIEDVARATDVIAREGRLGDTYHISTERIISIRDLVALICSATGAKFEDSVEVIGERLGKDAAYQLDSSKLRRELGWRDTVQLEQGIEQTIRWVDRFFDDLKRQEQNYVHKP